MLSESERRFVDSHRVAHLASADRAAVPHVVPVCFALSRETLYITIDDKPIAVTGLAWMDREWSSQPLAADQSGWDWVALHFDGGEKLMLYRMRQADGRHYASGNWISPDGKGSPLTTNEIAMTPKGTTDIAGRKIPTAWHVAIPRLNLAIDCSPLNAKSWMGTSFAYWEGPISFAGSHRGVGYLELTGY